MSMPIVILMGHAACWKRPTRDVYKRQGEDVDVDPAEVFGDAIELVDRARGADYPVVAEATRETKGRPRVAKVAAADVYKRQMMNTIAVKVAVRKGDEKEAKSVATAATMATSQIDSSAAATTSCR